jgi:hypothetical protein
MAVLIYLMAHAALFAGAGFQDRTVIPATGPINTYSGQDSGLVMITVDEPKEWGGITGDSEFYLIVDGQPYIMVRQAWIEELKRTKELDESVKDEMLRYLGQPRNVIINKKRAP